jgi:putative oxidoreductase
MCMTISRRVARPLLSSMFIMGGWDSLRNPEGKVKRADPVAQAVATRVPGLPQETETLIQINGGVMVGAGVLLAIGKFPRLAAVALIGTILPTTFAGHRFWEETDEATKAQQRIHFIKNLGLLGGLILAAVDTEGQPSLSWRARRRAERAGRVLHARSSRNTKTAPRLRGLARRARGLPRPSIQVPTIQVPSIQVPSIQVPRVPVPREALSEVQQVAARTAQRSRSAAEPVLTTGVQKASELLETVAGHVQDVVPIG